MKDCADCGKIYADHFDDCPHCKGAIGKGAAYVMLVILGFGIAAGIWALSETSQRSSPPPANATSASPPKGPSDPYAAGQAMIGRTEYDQAKETLIRTARMAASAARCRVISDVESNLIDRNGIHRISEADLANGRSDYHPDLIRAIGAAAKEAYRQAGEPGGCAFWQQNPQAVAEMRRLGTLSTMQ